VMTSEELSTLESTTDFNSSLDCCCLFYSVSPASFLLSNQILRHKEKFTFFIFSGHFCMLLVK